MYLHISVVTLQILVSFVIWTVINIIATKDKEYLYNTLAIFYFIVIMFI